jgi:hypothetical protein
MSDAAPPPLPSRSPARPPVPVGPVLLTIFVGGGVLLATAAGVAALVASHKAAPRVARAKHRRAEASNRRGLLDAATSQLETLAMRICGAATAAGELPETLPQSPPKDPWGRPLEYERNSPERAVLRSAGPDGKFGTRDDVRRDLSLR